MLEIVDKIPVILNALPYILQGGVVTLITVIGSLALGFCIGLPLAVLQVYGPSFIRRLIGVYVWFFRGMPILLLLFLFYFGLFEVIGLNLSTITASCLVLGMASAAYQSQIFRGSIETLPVGQFRAARHPAYRPSAGPAPVHPRLVQRIFHPAQGLGPVLRPRDPGNHGPHPLRGLADLRAPAALHHGRPVVLRHHPCGRAHPPRAGTQGPYSRLRRQRLHVRHVTMNTTPILRATNIVKKLGGKTILNDVSLDVHKGDVKVVIGPSGAGKSTFLQCLNYLLPPDSGDIWLEGKKVNARDTRELCALRQQVGMIFQDFNLFDHLTAEENVSIALRKVMGCNKAEARNRALTELSRVGLAKRAALYPAQLSGGQKQRVAIARALAMDPKVMLLDEPTSALDPELVGEVLSVIRDLADGGMTMIMATHQMDFARALATDILFMEQGKIIEQGAPDVLLAPGSGTRTSDFCGKLFDLRGTEKSDEPTVSELLTGDLSHDITDDGSESSMIPDAPKKD